MTDDKRSIERRLEALLEASTGTSRFTSVIFKIAAILGFLLTIVAAVGCVMMLMKSGTAEDDVKTVKSQAVKYKEWLERAIQDNRSRSEELDILVKELETVKASVKDYKNKTDEMKIKIDTMQENIGKVNKTLEEVTKDRDVQKQLNGELNKEKEQLDKDFANMTHYVHDLNTTFTHADEILDLWKIGTGVGLLGVGIGGFMEINAHVSVWEREEQIRAAQQHERDFHLMAPGFENYTFLSRSLGAETKRETCFQNGQKADLKACENASPTLTTITTTTGYRFSVFLSIPFKSEPGQFADARSFAVSSNHGAMAKLKDVDHALVMDNTHLIQFGKTGITIALSGENGTAKGDSYDVPAPYHNENFFHNGTSFFISEIKIQKLHFT